jgi:hypothetical protein
MRTVPESATGTINSLVSARRPDCLNRPPPSVSAVWDALRKTQPSPHPGLPDLWQALSPLPLGMVRTTIATLAHPTFDANALAVLNARGGAMVGPPPAKSRTLRVNTTIPVDGRAVCKAVTTHIVDQASSAQTGSNTADWRAALHPTSVPSTP